MITLTKSQSMQENEIVLYQPNETTRIEVRLDDETVWLTLDQMADLFQRNKSTISRHIKNIFETGELNEDSTVAFFATVQIEGKRRVERNIAFYNLDVIISVGYRVNSYRGVQFRQWANKVLKEYLLIDNDVYHVGASIKDLGKRWFAIMKMQDTKADQILSHILPTGGGKIDSKSDYFTAKTISLLRRFVSYAAGLFFALLLFASCQDGQFPPVGTYENAEGEYYHFCSDNSFHCKISEIDHLLTGLYEQLGDSTILLTFYDEDGYETGDEVALRFSQCAPDSFYIESVGGTPIHKVKYVKKK